MNLYRESLALFTDLYQLTMVYGYWKAKIATRHAAFHLHFRKWPFQGGYALAAGLETAIDFLKNFHFSESDLSYLQGLDLFEEEFLHFLSEFSFACDVDAMPEGSLVFPYEPILRVQGPIWQAQLLESPMLNLINFQSLIATKAARICQAAFPDPVVEFGMRRAQGIDGAISASRAAFVGGCPSTSHVLAGKLFGIPVKGTHAHSWIMAFDQEEEAFAAFAQAMPKECVMLVDTYDSVEGVRRAVAIAKKVKETHRDFELAGVRLDSGDLARLSIEIRKILDKEGFSNAQIMASNELDEYLIRDLKQQGAKISLWGVGTHLVTGKEQPALDGIYKLSAVQDASGKWIHKIKLSEQTTKTTNPGILQVRRFFDGKIYRGDVIYDSLLGQDHVGIDLFDASREIAPSGEFHDVLVPIFQKGKLVYQSPSLPEIQARSKEELLRLPASMKRFTNPELYPVGLEKKLYRKKLELMQALKR